MRPGHIQRQTYDYTPARHHHPCSPRWRSPPARSPTQTPPPPHRVPCLRQAGRLGLSPGCAACGLRHPATRKHAMVNAWLARKPACTSTSPRPAAPGSTSSNASSPPSPTRPSTSAHLHLPRRSHHRHRDPHRRLERTQSSLHLDQDRRRATRQDQNTEDRNRRPYRSLATAPDAGTTGCYLHTIVIDLTWQLNLNGLLAVSKFLISGKP
jgi:hypothetical protein